MDAGSASDDADFFEFGTEAGSVDGADFNNDAPPGGGDSENDFPFIASANPFDARAASNFHVEIVDAEVVLSSASDDDPFAECFDRLASTDAERRRCRIDCDSRCR